MRQLAALPEGAGRQVLWLTLPLGSPNTREIEPEGTEGASRFVPANVRLIDTASALRVDPDLYQHIDPAVVGNDMRMIISDMAGRASIELKGRELGFELADEPEAGDTVVRAEDGTGAPVFIDPVSLDFLQGAELDWADALMGAHFAVRNPQAVSGCGCGVSFAVG